MSLRHRVTPPHESTPTDVVVDVDVDVGKRSVVVVVGLTSPRATCNVVHVSTRNDIQEALLVSLSQRGTTSACCLHVGADMATATRSSHKTAVFHVDPVWPCLSWGAADHGLQKSLHWLLYDATVSLFPDSNLRTHKTVGF